MIHPAVVKLLEHCPFLQPQIGEDWLDLPTVVFGAAARAISEGSLSQTQENQVFAYFNELAAHGGIDDLEILGTGAIELFNDDAAIQKLARTKLCGSALQMLERFRVGWGQPDYAKPARD